MSRRTTTARAAMPPATPREALRTRLMHAVDGLVTRASDAHVLDAIAAQTGSGALARLVSQLAEVSPASATNDPLAAGVARTALWRQQYASATPLLDAGEAMAQLGVTSSEALRKRDRAGTIIALPLGTGKYAYPAWQIVDGRVIAGLAAVRRALGNPTPWVFAGQLDGVRDAGDANAPTLRELLLAGSTVQAVSAAAAITESGGA
jgi:hypothetical protein